MWILWHTVDTLKIYKELVRIITKPLGYREDANQTISYLRLKNFFFTTKEIQLRLYLIDNSGEEREFQIRTIEKWGTEKLWKTQILDDLVIVIPSKIEIGLYRQNAMI